MGDGKDHSTKHTVTSLIPGAPRGPSALERKKMGKIKLRYRRLPDRVTVYKQELLYDDGKLIVSRVTLRPKRPLVHADRVLIGPGYRAIWFVVVGEWHDLGKIYDCQGNLQGYYCDIIRPMRRTAEGLEIDDLLLDLWVSPDRQWLVLDEDEFAEAKREGWLEPPTAARARRELEELIAEVESGRFPPPLVERFTI